MSELDQNEDLEPVPLSEFHKGKAKKWPMAVKFGISWAISAGICVLLITLCREISTFAAWTCVMFAVGLVGFLISCWGEAKKLREFGRLVASAGLSAGLVCGVKLVLWYKS
jgi:VIT1/CCC1 family predicted Fe2+/Mn2+ transporter